MNLEPNALCTVADVKALVQPDMSTQQDELFKMLINAFAYAAESQRWCNRLFEKKARQEYHNGGADYIIVASPPIDMHVGIVIYDGGPDMLFDETTIIDSDAYGIDWEKGIIRFDYEPPYCGTNSVRVDYVGGLVVPELSDGIPVGPAIVPGDLRTASVMQVTAWFRNKNFFGINAVQMGGGGAVSISDPSKMLPFVKDTLMSYRRFD